MPYFTNCVAQPGLYRVERHNKEGTVCLCAREDRLLVVVSGEPPGPALLECFEEARAEGWIRHSMKTLVDMRRFVGVVDWQSLNRLRQMADWGDDHSYTRTAYLVRNENFEPLIKIAGVLFRCCQHKTFTSRDLAVAWLQS